MDNTENMIMTKEYKGHNLTLLVHNEYGIWQGVVNCEECYMHYHFDTLDFLNPDAMLFVEGELSMHAAGVNEGWNPGPGFKVADDATAEVDTDDTI